MSSDLLRSFGNYDEFNGELYFTTIYKVLPSKFHFNLPLEVKKDNIEVVLNKIDFSEFSLKEVFRKCKAKNQKKSVIADDFPYKIVFRSNTHSLVIAIVLSDDKLFVEFLYHNEKKEVEAWIHSTIQGIREEIGITDKSKFKVLSKDGGDFYTEDIQTNEFNIDVAKLYNDDFVEVDKIIKESLSDESSGLILLHGTPGTGKTSYIKHLITEYKKISFIFIQNEFINELLNPNFISFLIINRNSVLIIEDAEKVITSREYSNESSVVSTILQLTDGLFSDYLNIKIICTFNTSIEKIDKALMRKGRMIANYKFTPLTSEKTEELLKERGHSTKNVSLTLADIFNHNDMDFDTEASNNGIGF